MRYLQSSVLINKKIAPEIFELTVACQNDARPGQFYMLKAPNGRTLLPRAISVYRRSDESITFLYQIVGEGTKELAALQLQQKVAVTGPLGNGFPLSGFGGKVALVGGGIGTAPLLYLAQALKENSTPTDVFLGFRDTPYGVEDFAPWANKLAVATESGTAGTKGYVTQLFDPSDYAAVLCCGPHPMMKAIAALCEAAGTPCYVSLENKMACGVGGCLVCTCGTREGKHRRVCQDGPVFLSQEVDFDA